MAWDRRATVRLIASNGDVYETKTGFTFTQLGSASLEPITMEENFTFDAMEILADDFHYSGSQNCTTFLTAGDTLLTDCERHVRLMRL